MKPPRQAKARARGFSLVELMVAMALGLIVVLAVTGVMVRGEGVKRSTAGVNDMNQTGAYLAYMLDRALRSAGSGFAHAQAFGCELNASRSNGRILPRTSAWPAPFAGMAQSIRLAPVIIDDDRSAAGSDVLVVMAGSAGHAESRLQVTARAANSTDLPLENTLGHHGGDMLLLTETGVGCMVQQVNSTFVDSAATDFLPLAGTYFSLTGASVDLGSLVMPKLMNLGNATTNAPQFQLFGVGNDATLFSYDLLRLDGGDAPMPISDGVVAMHAVYGIDGNDDGVLDAWADPATSPYTAAELRSGSAAAEANLRRILAVRVALVLRSPLVEREDVSEATLTLFPDLPAAQQETVTLSGDALRRRHRVVDFTVPLRNLLLQAP